MQAKEDVTDLLTQKADIEKEHKDLLAQAAEKEKLLKAKVRLIGNLVHDSVPVSNNEVCFSVPSINSENLLKPDLEQDDNTVERTWAPEGVAFEKRDVLSREHTAMHIFWGSSC